MNISSLNSMNNSIEIWFVPIDSFSLIIITITLLLGIIFLLIAATHKTCWTVPLMLICNSCIAELLLSSTIFFINLIALQNDLEHNQNQNFFCIVLGYLSCFTDFLQNYSYLLNAIYQYITIVHPARIIWRSFKVQIYLIGIQWTSAVVFILPLLLTKEMTFNIDNQICQVPLSLSPSIIYLSVVLYSMPNTAIMLIYIKLARFVRQMGIRAAGTPTLFHARRELRLLRRTFILVNILIILGFPYLIFVLISFFTSPPKYHFRIAYFFINMAVLLIIINMFNFTQPIKTIIRKKLCCRLNMVEPILDLRT